MILNNKGLYVPVRANLQAVSLNKLLPGDLFRFNDTQKKFSPSVIYRVVCANSLFVQFDKGPSYPIIELGYNSKYFDCSVFKYI